MLCFVKRFSFFQDIYINHKVLANISEKVITLFCNEVEENSFGPKLKRVRNLEIILPLTIENLF